MSTNDRRRTKRQASMDALRDLIASPDTQVCAHYGPGFAADLTSWYSLVRDDGSMVQAILWFDFSEGLRTSLDYRSSQLTAGVQEELSNLSLRLDRSAFSRVEGSLHVTDVSTIDLRLFAQQIKASLPWHFMEQEIQRGDLELQPSEQLAFDLFGEIWRLIDRHAPYSTEQHAARPLPSW